MYYIALSIIFLLVHSFLIFSTNFNIWPELYFLPWLVQKGLLPYRDFFDHHGFLLYYLLAPLTFDKTYFALKIFYYLIQSANLILVLKILRKTTSRFGFILGGILYVLINFFIGENNLWYETVITTFYLVIYLLLISKNLKNKSYILGLLAGLVSLIKPGAGIVLLPILFVRRDIKIVLSFFSLWFITFLYFLSQNSSTQLIQGMFLFNNFLVKNYRPTFFSDAKFLSSSLFLISFSIIINWKNRDMKKAILPLFFLLISQVFWFTGYGRWHLLPVFTFAVILIAQALRYKTSLAKCLFIIFILIYSILLFRKVISHRNYLNSQRIPWQEDTRSREIITALKNIDISGKNLYVFSNHSQIYQALDKLPPTYFAIKFPSDEKYFLDYEKRIISDLEKNKVVYIAIPKPIEEEYVKLPLLESYIKNYYKLSQNTDQYQIYDINYSR